MSDEIKEILDLFGSADENIMFCDIVELNSKQSHLLLDYITNLQKTNKNHSKKLIELGNKITNLQQEIYKLIRISIVQKKQIKNLKKKKKNLQQEIERQSKAQVILDNMLAEYKQENERLKENNQNMQEEMARTWQKCDDLQQENKRLSNFIHEFLDYCEKCYENNKDSQDYPYCYIRKAEELIEKYKIGDDNGND